MDKVREAILSTMVGIRKEQIQVLSGQEGTDKIGKRDVLPRGEGT